MQLRRNRPAKTRRMSRTEMRMREGAFTAGKTGESGSDSEVVGVSGSLFLEAAVGRSRNAGFDIRWLNGGSCGVKLSIRT